MKKQCTVTFEDIISPENLLLAWGEFLPGKRRKPDVMEFFLRLMQNILALHDDLRNGIYEHGPYQAFNVSAPKPRNIHKAAVRDRLLHHAIHRKLYPFFDSVFIADSFSCRVDKGTHRALNRFRDFAYTVSKNHTRTCWVLKCDIKKFFANIDQAALLEILDSSISDKRCMWLFRRIISSFNTGTPGIGLPLGNLTSQLLVNIYMNEFDQFVKHVLKAKYYIRYADDFVFLSEDQGWLEELLPRIDAFLSERLHLRLHPDKIFIKTFASGVDFLGWVHFPDHRVLRTATKKRMLRRVSEHPTNETIMSYRRMLRHGNAKKLENQIAFSSFSKTAIQ